MVILKFVEPAEKKTTVSTTTKKVPSSSPRPYYTSPKPSITATTHHIPKVITTHHFPVSNSADIRFNPEEINISLKPGSRPEIRPNPISYQQSSNYNTNGDKSKRVIVTTHTTVYKSERKEEIHDKISSTSSKSHPVENYHNNHNHNPTEINYEFAYHDTEEPEYHTEPAYKYQEPSIHFEPQINNPQNYQSTTYRSSQLNPVTGRVATTYRQQPIHSSTLKISEPYQYHSTEKPSRLQLPLPLLPTLSPLTFSSPAPFSTHRHEDTKRYSEQHIPRIVISASASVSDASGRKLNYTFGPLETAQIFDSYEDYKDDDEGVESFYHDVPKLKKAKRKRRSVDSKKADIIKNEEEAIGVLKFLFDWYSTQEKSTKVSIPLKPELITEINDELTPTANNDEPTTITSSEESSQENSAVRDKNDITIKTTNATDYDYEDSDDIKKDSSENSGKEYNKKIEPYAKIKKDIKNIDTYEYVDDNYEIDLYNQQLQQNSSEENKNSTLNSTNENVTLQSDGVSKSNSKDESLNLYDDYVDDNYESELYKQQVAKNKTSMFDYDIDYVDDNYEADLYQEQALLKRLHDLSVGTNQDKKNVSDEYDFSATSTEAIESHETETSDYSLNSQENNSQKDIKDNFIKETKLRDPTETNAVFTTSATTELSQESYNSVEESFITSTPNYEPTTTNDVTTITQIENKVENSIQNHSEVTHEENLKASSEENSKELSNENAKYVEVEKNEKKHDETKKYTRDRERSYRGRGKKRFEFNEESHKSDSSSTSRSKSRRNRFRSTTTTTTEYTPTEITEGIETTTILDLNDSHPTTTDAVFSNEDNSHVNAEERIDVIKVGEVIENITNSTKISTDVLTLQDEELSNEDDIYTTTTLPSSEFVVHEIETATKSIVNLNMDIPTTDSYVTTTSNIEQYLPEIHFETTETLNSDLSTKADVPIISTVETTTADASFPETLQTENLSTTVIALKDFLTTTTTNAETVLASFPKYDSTTIQIPVSQIPENYPSTIASITEDYVTVPAATETIVERETTEEHQTTFITTPKIAATTLPVIVSVTPEITTSPIETSTAKTLPTTSEIVLETTTTKSGRARATKKRERNYQRRQKTSNHRFSQNRRTYNNKKKETLDKTEISASTPSNLTKHKIDSIQNKIKVKEKEYNKKLEEVIPLTEAPLLKSANPTLAKDNNYNNNKKILTTTPLSKLVRIQLRREKLNKNYIFNCFDKLINQFYSDPRDCRLFHYCTSGYTKNQLLDMKFVCDFGTYFDEEKLICTKIKPLRCT